MVSRGCVLLAQYLRSQELSQTEFGLFLNKPQATISHWLRGSRSPGANNALMLERATRSEVPADAWEIQATRKEVAGYMRTLGELALHQLSNRKRIA